MNQSDRSADQVDENDGAPEADDTFTGHERGVGGDRADGAVRCCPAPKEPFGVAAVPEAGLVVRCGGVDVGAAVGFDHTAITGVSKR